MSIAPSIAVGQRFGRLTVASFVEVRSKRARWECVCDCGRRFVTMGQSLKSGGTASCGCARGVAGSELTFDDLQSRLMYDHKKGVFLKAARGNHEGALGEPVRVWINRTGYVQISVRRKNYCVHRLAWFYTYGKWPVGDIDHINGDRADNRIANLRDVSRSVNMQNRRSARRDSASGYLGVSPLKNGKWRATISVAGRQVHLGVFETPKEAHSIYVERKREMHKGNTL